MDERPRGMQLLFLGDRNHIGDPPNDVGESNSLRVSLHGVGIPS